MNRTPLLARVARPIFVIALLVCGVSAWKWFYAGSARGHFARADALVRQRKGPEAEAEWKAVLSHDPSNASAQELLAEYYMSRSDWPRAVEAFRRLHQVAPEKPHVLCRLAACLLRMDDQKSAFQTADLELKRSPDCVAALGLITTLMSQRPGTEPKRRLDYLRRLARLVPDDLTVQRMYAESLANEYLYDELRPVLAAIQRLAPNDVQAYNLLGVIDLSSSDQPQGSQDAIKQYEASLRAAPVNPGAHFGLGRAYLRLGKSRQAVGELEEAVRYMPNVARVYKELADAYRANHQIALSSRAQSRFLELQRLGADERTLSVRCIAYPNDPRYPRQLGELYVKQRDPGRALYYLRKANSLQPGDRKLQELIARTQAAASGMAVAASRIPPY